MSVDKYSQTLDELACFGEHSQRLLAELRFLLRYSAERLDFGMHQWKHVDKKPSFDQAKPPYSYGEKNFYVNASNNLWFETMWSSYPELSEIYYNNLLTKIKEFKTNEDFDFNKGIVYGNLGVAQSAQMKLDEGFANILKALIEDSGYSSTNKPQYDLYRRELFTQFEKRYVQSHLQNMILKLNVISTTSVEKFVENFLDSLSEDQRAFFDYTFARIRQNVEIWNEKENDFTANRLLAYTQDLCLFNEDFLKSKTPPSRLATKPHWELGDLIPENFSSQRINLQKCGANNMNELDYKLASDLNNQNQLERCLRILLTLRNYSSHNVGGGTSKNIFYAQYVKILSELIRAMCLITQLP